MNVVHNPLISKLIKKAACGNDEIHFVIREDGETHVVLGGAHIDYSVAVICQVNQERCSFSGRAFGKEIYSEEDINLRMGLLIDTRDIEEIECHYYDCSYEKSFFKNDREKSKDLIIAYIEAATFSQLFLFDNSLSVGEKYVSQFTKEARTKQNLKSIAFSYMCKVEPRIQDFLFEK